MCKKRLRCYILLNLNDIIVVEFFLQMKICNKYNSKAQADRRKFIWYKCLIETTEVVLSFLLNVTAFSEICA